MAKMIEKSKQAIIEKAGAEIMPEEFLKKTNDEYARIKVNPQLWCAGLQEREEWDVALNDGLED